MALPEVVILDTSAIYALISESDQFHERASSVLERLVDREQRMAITSYVFTETIALVHRRLGFHLAKGLWDSLSGRTEMYWIEETVHRTAWQEFERAAGAGPSFVDWTTIVAARRLGAYVFAFDPDFAQAGVTVVQ